MLFGPRALISGREWGGGRMGWGGGGEQFVIGWVGLIAAWWYPVSVGLSSLHTYMRSGPARLLLKDSFTRFVASGFFMKYTIVINNLVIASSYFFLKIFDTLGSFQASFW